MAEPPPLALVTGGCRRLGAAIAGHLAQQGWSLALHGHRSNQPEKALARILDETGTIWEGFMADLAKTDDVENLVPAVQARFGRVPDLLVNNAAIFGQDDWQSMTGDTIHQHMQVNFTAPVLLARSLVAAADKQVAIVHIVDQRVRNPHGDQLSYTFSKQALAASVRTMAKAYGARARVNAVAPGLTIGTQDYDEDRIARVAQAMPLGYNSLPHDIAGAVAYLANARAITGEVICVDGGAHLKGFERDFMYL